MSENIRVDVLFKGVKDLKQERQGLEQKLNDLRNERASVAAKLEACATKHRQTKDVHMKLSETLKVAQHKAIESQNKIHNFEEIASKKRSRLTEFNKNIENEKGNQQAYTLDFEGNLAKLTASFLDAKNVFKDDALMTSSVGSRNEAKKSQVNTESLSNEIRKLNSCLKDLNLDQEKTEPCPFSSDEQLFILTELDQEGLRAKKALSVVEERVAHQDKLVANFSETETQDEVMA